jgi:phosphoribosylformylglycinamidine synthase
VFRIRRGETTVGELPVALLVNDCPLYDLHPEAPTEPLYGAPAAVLDADADAATTLLALLASANLASRHSVFEQYDPVVQSRTVRRPAQTDAAVLALPDTAATGASGAEPIPGIGVSIDGNGRRVAVDPRAGAAEVVYECAANLACVGAEPLGLTNCLNFGNPEKPHVAWQLSEAVDGLAQACRDLDVPVIGGNVSLYNESPDGPILPTPVIGMVGTLPDVRHVGRLGFVSAGDVIALVGAFTPGRDGSELAKLRGAGPVGELPTKDLDALRAAHRTVREGIRAGRFASAHDIAEGGVVTALAECCVAGGLGAEITLPAGLDPFGEDFGTGFIVSGPAAAFDGAAGATVLGAAGGATLTVRGLLELPLAQLTAAHRDGLSALTARSLPAEGH